jgi:hypothetical protein
MSILATFTVSKLTQPLPGKHLDALFGDAATGTEPLPASSPAR